MARSSGGRLFPNLDDFAKINKGTGFLYVLMSRKVDSNKKTLLDESSKNI